MGIDVITHNNKKKKHSIFESNNVRNQRAGMRTKMCGRYYVDDETAAEINRIIQQLNTRLETSKKGEIYPTNTAPIIINMENKTGRIDVNWGFPKFKGSGVIINARAETALEKNMFRKSLLERRCVIPAKHFYEWDRNKTKIAFYDENNPIMYMAGFYNTFKEEERFVILTTNANTSMEDVHNRMPVLIREEEIESWIFDEIKMEQILYRVPYKISRETEIEKRIHAND